MVMIVIVIGIGIVMVIVMMVVLWEKEMRYPVSQWIHHKIWNGEKVVPS